MMHTNRTYIRASFTLACVHVKTSSRVQPRALASPDGSTKKWKSSRALDTADMCINNYCKSLEGQDKQQCEFALEEFRIRRHESETRCLLPEDPNDIGNSCQELEQMEDMARQVGYSGKDLVAVSSHFQVPTFLEESTDVRQDLSESRKLLAEIFQENDRNGDGFLDVEELQSALRQLGHYITGQEVKMILGSFDTQFGYMIDYEEFEDIAESDFMDDDPEARMLRQRN